jgi:hypothetical protein
MKHKGLKLTLLFICVLCTITLVTLKALLWVDNSIQYTSKASSTSIESLTASEKSEGVLYLNSENINTLLQGYGRELKADGKLKLGLPHIEIKENKLFCYTPVSYGNLNLMASFTGTLKLEENNFVFLPQSFKIGKVPISKKLVMKKLSSYSNKNVTIDATNITIKKDILPFSISSIVVDGNTLIVKLNKVALEVPEKNSANNSSSKSAPTTEENTTKKSNSNNSAPKNSPIPEKNTEKPSPKVTQAQENQKVNLPSELLLSTSNQLRAVYASAKTSEEKKLISLIQNTVNKLIENPSFNTTTATEEVKVQYNKLNKIQRADLLASVLRNMQYNTLLELKSKFGL